MQRGDAGRPTEEASAEIVPPVGTIKSPYAQALTSHGISSQSASRYQRLAGVPKQNRAQLADVEDDLDVSS